MSALATDEILDEPLAEVARIVGHGREDGLALSGTGGVAIAIGCPSARTEPLRREYGDLDFVARSEDVGHVTDVFTRLGYRPDAEFNALHGDSRLFFLDTERRREADVFLDAVRGCHELTVRDRLGGVTLPCADLLLSKLQVRQTNRKDLQDAFAILLDHDLTDDDTGISRGRLQEVCGGDWGWWRTVTEVSRRAEDSTDTILTEPSQGDRVRGALSSIRALIDDAPKSRKWRMRARLGDRVRWYEEPEELDHGH